MGDGSARRRFAEQAARSDDDIDLAEAALLIAAEEHPDLNVPACLQRLSEFAAEAQPFARSATSSAERARCLTHFLHVQQRFAGNQQDYYDPSNSFLNEVLEHRRGIPITLSLVYIEVGRRLGWQVEGIGFPGHFLAKCVGDEDVVIDPFFGRVLDESGCRQRLHSILGPEAPFHPELLRSSSSREILVRMLANLKHIYLRQRDLTRCVACIDRILILCPDSAQEHRDRGLLYQQLECIGAARADLERFLELAPEDPSAEAVREQLVVLARQRVLLH